MKKIILSLFLILTCVLITPFFTTAYASEELKINTIYPENIIDYEDLSNIEFLTVNQDYIAYVTNNISEKITIINKSSRNKSYITDIQNILDIKYFNSNLIIATSNSVYIYKDNNITELNSLSNNNFILADIHIKGDSAHIGFIKNDTITVYSINKSLEISNPILNETHHDFSSAYILTINNSHAYVVTNPSLSSHKIYSIDLNTKAQSYDTFISNVSIMDTITFNNKEYFIAFSESNGLSLFKKEGNEYNKINSSIIDINDYGINDNNHFPIFNVKDIEVYNDTIYICDSYYKTIQSYILFDNNSNMEIHSQNILISSDSAYLGRFSNLKDVKIHGDKILTADSGNNRLQILSGYDNCNVIEIKDLSNISNIESDTNSLETIYIATDNSISQYIYDIDEQKYMKNNYYNISNNNISDIVMDNDNILYILNSYKNRLEYIQDNNVITLKTFEFDITNNSKIIYLKQKELFVVLNNTSLILLDNQGNIIDTLTEINYSEISCDLENVYALFNNQIKFITISNENKLTTTNKTIDLTQYSTIKNLTIDIIKNKILFFDTNKNCLSYLDNNLHNTSFTELGINSEVSINSINEIIPIELFEDSIVYEFPYHLGKQTILEDTKYCIGIEKYNDFYRILFNKNNSLTSGYVHKNNIKEIIDIEETNSINAIVTNQKAPIYKYPTILTYNNNLLSLDYITIDTQIELICKFPVSIDNKSMYLINYNNKIGFLSSSDVIESSKNIDNLYINNATVTSFGSSDEIIIYSEDKTTVLFTIKDGEKIYANNYDKDSEYTHIFYTNENLETFEGYIKTENIKMDTLDNSQIILIVIIIVSIIILGLITIFYFHLRKKPR